MKMFRLVLSITILAAMGCLFESGGRVAGGEDFPNTITPLGKVAADDISSNTQWDQFQGIPQPTDVLSSADSLLSVTTVSAKLSATQWDMDPDRDYFVEQHEADVDVHLHMKIDGGPDHNFNTKFDNRVREFDVLRTRNSDTLEWTRLTDSDGDSDGVLWGEGDSGTILLRYVSFSQPLKPQVQRRSITLQAAIYHRGDSAVLRTYRDENLLENGTFTVLSAKGIRADSSLRLGDTAIITFDQTPSADAALQQSNSRYWVRFGTQQWRFTDNALLHFSVENLWRSGVIRHSLLDFTPAEPLVSGRIDIHGDFTVSTENYDGTSADVTGTFQGDTIQAEMYELRGGKRTGYHMIYDSRGTVKAKERLPD